MEILVGAEIDLFVPSFPEIQTIFNISTFEVELLLGVNFIGHCITSLIVGNLGDRFGRKAIIIIGLIIFARPRSTYSTIWFLSRSYGGSMLHWQFF